jgi:SAM-dependent methyltransferase
MSEHFSRLTTKARGLFYRVVFENLGGLDTTTVVRLADVNEDDHGRSNYIPSGWATLKHLTSIRPLGPDDVFLDIGSGKGRVVFLAATHRIKRVIGVELSSTLHVVAQENLRLARKWLVCKDIEFACGDATTYQVPDDVTIVYFFNPFVGPPFMKVIDNIGESIRRRPRKVHIFYTNPVMHDEVMQRSWVRVCDYNKGSVAVYECV